jgi:hypothetical protein
MATMTVTIIGIVRNATSVKRFDTVWEKACRNAKIGVPFLKVQQGVEKQASGPQPRRVAFWKAQHIHRYVSIYKSRTTPDHGLRRGFSIPC